MEGEELKEELDALLDRVGFDLQDPRRRQARPQANVGPQITPEAARLQPQVMLNEALAIMKTRVA